MANDSEYLKALLSRKGEISQAQTSSSSGQSSSRSTSWGVWDDIFGGIDELAAQFGSGFVSAFEGIGDLAATGLGALGDATGWYSSKPFTDWASQDVGSKAAKWVKTYANLTPWNIIKNVQNGTYLNGDYWGDMAPSFWDTISTSSSDSLDDDVADYYDFDDGTKLNSNAFGQFAGGVVHSIGMMLPSIMIGNAAGAASGSAGLAKAVGVGLESLAAGGKSSEEALNDGANAGQALGYGVLSGAVEAGTEYIPWEKIPGLGKLLGENVAPGIGLRQFSAKELAKSMAQEGLEEVVSDLANPVIQMVYKGTDSLGQYTDPEYYKDIFVSFMSGAVTGGIMEGATSYSNTRKYSNAGVQVINDTSQWVRDYDSWAERNVQIEDSFINGNLTLDQYEARMESQAKALLKLNESGSDITERFDKLDSKYKEAVQDYIKDPSAIKDAMEDEGNKRLLQSKGLPLQYGRVEYDANATNSNQTQISATQSADVANTLGSVYNQGDGNEFGRLQEESRRELNESSWQERSARNDEALRERLSSDIQRELERRGYNPSSSDVAVLRSSKGTEFTLYENVDGQTFRDVFEISRTYLANGELVDLHEVKSSEKGVGYEDTTNYLSSDGLSGFAITKGGDLISVFNVNKGKKGFLDAISGIIKEKVKTLDCYVSPNQNLQEMYEKKFGFKTASIMDHNMEYDHDDIAKNHNNPKVAFMVNTNQDVETKHFNKDQYAEAQEYQMSYVNGSESQKEATQTVKSSDSAKEAINASANDNQKTVKSIEQKDTEVKQSERSKALNEEANNLKAEDKDKAYKKAVNYFNAPQQLLKDAAPDQTVTLKKANEYASYERTIISNAVEKRLGKGATFSYASNDTNAKLYAAAIDSNSKAQALTAMDRIFDKSVADSTVRSSGVSLPLSSILTKTEINSLKQLAHSFHESLLNESSQSKISANMGALENKIDALMRKVSNTVELAKEIDRFNKNAEITKRQYRIDQRRYAAEYETDGALRKLARLLPKYNYTLKNGSRASDNAGVALRKDAYVKWATDSLTEITKINDQGMLVNGAGSDIMAELSNVIYGGDPNSKSLTADQVRSLTSVMKMLRAQLSQRATEIRIKNRDSASKVNKGLEFRMKAMPSSTNSWARMAETFASEQVKLMEMGDYISGYDNSELQQRMNVLIKAKDSFNKDYYDLKKNYIDTDDSKSFRKMMKGKVTVNGQKVLKSEAMDVYLQLSDPETRALMDADDSKATRRIRFAKEKFSIEYDSDTFETLKSKFTQEEIDLARKVFGRFYSEDSEGVYKERLRKLQMERKGDTLIPEDSSDFYYPRSLSSESTVRANSLQSLEKTKAGIKPSNTNLNKERQAKQSIAVLEAGDSLSKAEGYAVQVANELNLAYPTNDFLSMLSLNIEGSDGKATRIQMTIGERYANLLRDFVSGINDIELVSSDGMIQFVQRGTVVSTLGLSPINPMKNFISIFREGYKTGFGSVAKFVLNPTKWVNGELYRAIKNTGTWQARYANGTLSMQADVSFNNRLGKLGKAATSFYTFADQITSLGVAGIDFEYVKKAYPNLSHEEQIQKAVDMWVADVNVTQSSGDRASKSESSSGRFMGRDSQITKAMWMFQSDTVAGASILFKDARMLQISDRMIKYANKIIDSDTATAEEISFAKEMLSKAQATRKSIITKRLPASVMATLIGALLKYLIEDLNSRVKGNKGWGEDLFDGDTMSEMVGNTLSSFVPFADTIMSAMNYNDGQIELFGFSGIAEVLQAINKFTAGKTRTGLVNLVFAVARMAGVPAKNLYDYFTGIVSTFDPAFAVEAKNLLYGAEASVTKYSDNFDMGLYERVGETSDKVSEEIKSLYDGGYSVRPSGVYETYTDKNGNEVTISWTDRQSMKRYYSRANSKLARLLTTDSYRQLGDSEKAYVINKLYKAYKDAALAKVVTKGTPDSIITALAYANYNDLGTILTAVAHIRTLEATSTSTKKQRAVAYVNSLGLPKSQRMLILSLAGYTVDSKYISSALRSAGISASEAKKIATA